MMPAGMTNIITNSEILTTFVKRARLKFPGQATRLVEVKMNAGAQGLVWCFTFVVLDAVQAVFFGGVFQRIDAFLIGSLVFGLTTAGAVSWTWVRDPEQILRAFENREALIGMNVSAAGGWIAYLLAIQLVEPAVAFTIFSGMVPITAIVAARFGVPEASRARNRFEMFGYIVLMFGLVALVAITLAGLSGFVRGGVVVAVAGISLAALSGALIAWMLFYCHRLDRAGVGPVAQFGLRFLFYLVLSLGGVALGLDAKGEVPVGDLALAVLVGLLVMAFPIYAVQKAVTLVSPLTIGAVTALGPLFVFGFQVVEARVVYAQATLFGLGIYFIGAAVAALGSAQAVRPEAKLRGLSATDIAIEKHDIAATVDREISRLQIDEFRSRG
jgi:drug/metabolite transporter (DMT)-like permease